MAVPADGVYAGRLSLLDAEGRTGRTYDAAISVGANVTFDGTERRVEAHCLDAPGLDLYGVRVGVSFIERLRPMVAFDGPDALVAGIEEDVARTRSVLGALEG
jgi:riboflavin kinase/FMN adenylyltransferase